MRISKASLLIRGPFYPEDHPLFGVADDWFGTLVEIKPDFATVQKIRSSLAEWHIGSLGSES